MLNSLAWFAVLNFRPTCITNSPLLHGSVNNTIIPYVVNIKALDLAAAYDVAIVNKRDSQ